MNLVQKLLERLRPIVNLKSWDYCVIWTLSDDQRFLEWMDCCCGGSENIQNGGEELIFPVSSVPHCRDVLFQHQRTKPCDLLAELPSSIPLDSGIYGQAIMSNQATWLNFSNNSDSNALEETVGTRVLIPVAIGLVELFVAKQVPEDQQIVDYVTSQTSILLEQPPMIHSSNMDPSFSMNNGIHEIQSKPFLGDESHQKDLNNPFQAPENPNLPYDISVDRIRLCNNSPMNFLPPFNNYPPSETRTRNDSFFDGAIDPFKSLAENGFQEMESLGNKEQQGTDKDSVKQETGRSESISDCSDINDDEDDAKYRRRTGKGPQSKNLEAERRRRKKLNDRLYTLRSLVPKISKLDRASILGDAIEFVKELQKQVKDLQLELEDQSDDEATDNHNNGRSESLNQSGTHVGSKPDHEKSPNGFHNNDSETNYDKPRQMEPQVEVAQLDGNEFFLKIFCEHKRGGFVRLMEALNSLGLEVTNVNVTSYRCLVSYVFKVEKRDSEMVQAEDVRDSLLEITRNPSGSGWSEMAKVSENGNSKDYHHNHSYHPNGNHSHLHGHHISSHHHHHHLHN
ncbi:Transcription factor ABORTED MICROSPORES like [Actinidia chinensis var. chinensis]|uniref:Transcription factor ABORTED MICROSPORES like n=1 Tax=Actinidia chinensis var. chinensis TaxID=1590841 RepID=A0A2R6QQB1_ACTCC|nr:Transcription factor ABORTED MICROSPORES like [Actinidia chinensis var. chinensis]